MLRLEAVFVWRVLWAIFDFVYLVHNKNNVNKNSKRLWERETVEVLQQKIAMTKWDSNCGFYFAKRNTNQNPELVCVRVF